MPLLKLSGESQAKFVQLPETGMGYHFAEAILRTGHQQTAKRQFLVLGSTYAAPLDDVPGLTSVAQLSARGRLNEFSAEGVVEGELFVTSDFTANPTSARHAMLTAFAARLKAGYIASLPPPGATLTVKASSTGDDSFLRFSYTQSDPRIGPGGAIAAGTYATTYRDGVIITSGLSAVGRYALPVPLPAKFIFALTPPYGTDVHFGAAVPYFGQAGGGVEAFFPKAFTNSMRSFSIPAY